MTVSEFEKLVLEAIYTGKLSVEDISSSTSLPPAVVEVCVRRLREKGLVTDSFELRDEALQLLSVTEAYDRKDTLRMVIDVLIFSVTLLLLLYLIEVLV